MPLGEFECKSGSQLVKSLVRSFKGVSIKLLETKMLFRDSIITVVALSVATLAAQTPSSNSSSVNSTVQGQGVGVVMLKPTTLRLSLPIKIYADASWDAAEKLREVRKEIVERASEMGSAENVRVVGYQCQPHVSSSMVNRAQTIKTRFVARCYVVADVPLPKMDDHEATVAVGQAQLEELASLIPAAETSRRSFTFSPTISSGVSSQQLETPTAFYVAKLSEQDRAEAFRSAMREARSQVDSALKALGATPSSLSVAQQSTSFVSSRPKHPVESEILKNPLEEAVGSYADAVEYRVRLMIYARFKLEDLNP